MQYVIIYTRCKNDINGNGRAYAEIYNAKGYETTNRRGKPITKHDTSVPVAGFEGYAQDVWDLVDRINESGKALVITRYSKQGIPKAGEGLRVNVSDYFRMFSAEHVPHVVIARVQNMCEDRQKAKA